MATYFGLMRNYGKRKKKHLTRQDEDDDEDEGDEEDDSLPTVSGRKISYPEELSIPREQKKRKVGDDPYKHLGPIGYVRNTWRSQGGPLQQAQNLFLGCHVKKTALSELARRMILAESLGGLPRNCDEDSLVSKEGYFYKKGKAPDRTRNMEIHEENKPVFDVSNFKLFNKR